LSTSRAWKTEKTIRLVFIHLNSRSNIKPGPF
jgi:hypothetical protein